MTSPRPDEPTHDAGTCRALARSYVRPVRKVGARGAEGAGMMAVLGAVMAVHSACPRAPVMSTGHHLSPAAPIGNHGTQESCPRVP